MARGFGASGSGGQGSADTDLLLAAYVGNSTQRSYAVWAYRTAAGGGNFGRIFEKPSSSQLLNNEGITAYRFTRSWSGVFAEWDVTSPSANTWVRVVVTYDGGSTANDPVVYYNGVSQTVVETVAPSGTLDTNSNAYEIGNRSVDSARVWHGSLAGLTMWNAILTLAEIEADAKGASPLLIRPQSLAFYAPLVGPVSDWVNAGAWTVGGTLVQPHPRMSHAEGLVLFAPHTTVGAETAQRSLPSLGRGIYQPILSGFAR